MRYLSLILDILVVAFVVVAFWRISVQETDAVIDQKQTVTEEHLDNRFDALDATFDDDTTSTTEETETAPAVGAQ